MILKVKRARSKYGNIKTPVDGILFHSKIEAKRYIVLKILKKQGIVLDFQMQVVYTFASGIQYILDFLVFWADGTITHEDVKGSILTDVYRLKKKLMQHEFNITLIEVTDITWTPLHSPLSAAKKRPRKKPFKSSALPASL